MNARAVAASFRQQFHQFTADPQWIIPSIIAPFIFTSVMLMMYPEKSDSIVLQAILGGGVLGMWGNTLFASSFTLSYDRMNGTLDNILMSPTQLIATLVSLATIGILFSIAFIFSRRSYILTSIFEYPIYILSGAVVPITMLPEWTNPISYVLAPTWGVEALRCSALPGYEAVFGFGMVGNALMCVALSVVYAAVSWFLMRRIVNNVLETGSFTRY